MNQPNQKTESTTWRELEPRRRRLVILIIAGSLAAGLVIGFSPSSIQAIAIPCLMLAAYLLGCFKCSVIGVQNFRNGRRLLGGLLIVLALFLFLLAINAVSILSDVLQ